jgi:hypothetical protein
VSERGTNHLDARTAQSLTLPERARIERILAPRWIGYPIAKQVLAKLESLLTYPKSHRMPNLLIIGETNNGKTMLLQRFQSLHPPIDTGDEAAIQVPVLVVQAPPTPDEGRLYTAILERLFTPFKSSFRLDRKQTEVIKRLQQVRIQLLAIDEIHHVLSGNQNRQKSFLNVIKYLGNELQVPIVGVGTRDAWRAIQTDPQLANRFAPMVLPRWEVDETFLRLLVSFERMLPLKEPSNLHEAKLAARLHAMCEGYIGELSRLLNEAAVKAIESGAERIDHKMLDAIQWATPTQRKRVLDRVSG